jgi:hypothetical protein
MTVLQRCLTCVHAMRDPNPTPEQRILGQVGAMCLGAPPSAQLVQHPNGQMAAVAVYPMVNAQTYSCGQWAPLPDAMNG